MGKKVSELTGQLLDFWAAKANGDFRHVDPKFYTSYPCPKYSTDWAQGGPIIEREGISIDIGDGSYKGNRKWSANMPGQVPLKSDEEITGQTPLIAAMRCYVASKFGDEVPNET